MTSNLIATADESTPYEKANDATEELPKEKQTGQLGGLDNEKAEQSTPKLDTLRSSEKSSGTSENPKNPDPTSHIRAAQGYTPENEMSEYIGA